jgi:hypothetical protein
VVVLVLQLNEVVQDHLYPPTGKVRAKLILPAWVYAISQILKDHPTRSNGEKSCRQAELLVLLAFRVNAEMEVLEAILVEVVIVEEPGIGTDQRVTFGDVAAGIDHDVIIVDEGQVVYSGIQGMFRVDDNLYSFSFGDLVKMVKMVRHPIKVGPESLGPRQDAFPSGLTHPMRSFYLLRTTPRTDSPQPLQAFFTSR